MNDEIIGISGIFGIDPNKSYHPDLEEINPYIAKINMDNYQPFKIFSSKQKQTILDAYNHLKNKGISDRNIATLFGNIMQESSFNQKAVQKGGDKAEGFFQMHTDRLEDYKKWKAEQPHLSNFPEIDYFVDAINSNRDTYMNGYNKSLRNIQKADSVYNSEVQRLKGKNNKSTRNLLNNRKAELQSAKDYHKTNYGPREAANELYPVIDLQKAWNDSTTSVSDLTDLFQNTFERAGTPDTKNRINYANLFYDYFQR